MLITPKHKEKGGSTKPQSISSGICIICSNKRCEESTDHSYLSFEEFKNLAFRSRAENSRIEEVKLKVTEFYKKVYRSIRDILHNQCVRARQSINKYYFNHLPELKAFELQILAQVLQNDSRSLPSRKILKLANCLNDSLKERRAKLFDLKCTDQFSEIFKKIDSKIKSFNIQSLQTSLKKETINIEQIIDKFQNSTTSTVRSLKQSRFTQQSSKQQQIFEWKNLKIRKIVRNVVLNCKKIADPQFLLNLPKLQKFTNIIQLDAHQNFLTHLSCVAIGNYLPQLTSLDLRSNNIGDVGLLKLKNMNNLKQLMADHNQITDNGTIHLLQGFPRLQLIWLDQNLITERGALVLYQKPILKICSVVGNQIDRSYHQQLKSLFSRKGLIYI